MKPLLVIGHTFPEPDTTAAGSRMMQLLQIFLDEDYQIVFTSTASISNKSADLQAKKISIKNIELNNSSFDVFVQQLNPEVVIFDRYITEEQFGWRISEQCPQALKILDTEDLHFLRKAREETVRKGKPLLETNLFTDVAKRELASILRCDLSLIISETEMTLLQDIFKIPKEIIYYLPLLVDSDFSSETIPSWKDRKDFVTIGNFLHAPNVDAVLQLKKLWPEIKRNFPEAQLHIYGAYAPAQIEQLHKPNEGFFIKGWAVDVRKIMDIARVQLSPLRFGAGLKGKLIDGMRFGLPGVTTKIGAEGLCGNLPFSGIIANGEQEFIDAAISLYSSEEAWEQAQKNGFDIIETRFKKSLFVDDFQKRLTELSQKLQEHRQQNFIGQILQHKSLQASKYLSKWIEAKNSAPQNASPVCYAKSNEVRDEYKE